MQSFYYGTKRPYKASLNLYIVFIYVLYRLSGNFKIIDIIIFLNFNVKPFEIFFITNFLDIVYWLV